jgi:hypothetical protein
MIADMSTRARRSAAPAAAVLLFALLLALAGEARADPACAPVVRVTGEPSLAGPVIALLRERGVSVDGESRCGTLTAVLTASGERTRVTIVDAEGRTALRMAEDARAAATVIESWARGDLSAPLLAAREPPPATVRARQAPDREAPPPIEQAAAIETRPIAIGAAAGAGLSSDGALWTWAHAQACVVVGPACLGALVRYASDTESQGDSNVRVTARRSLDLLVIADVPLRLGPVVVIPGVGFGQTALRAQRQSGDHEKVTTTGMNLRARVGAGVPVVGVWSLQADVALGASPFARKLLREEQFGPVDPDDDDPSPMSGVPRLTGWFGLALVYGGL